MKICWDNIEDLRYSKKTGKWYDKKGNVLEFKEECKTCGEPFLGKHKSDYCSKNCMYRRGFSCTEEQKQKISKKLKGRKHSEIHNKNVSDALKEYYKTHDATFLGRTHTEESRRRIGEAHKISPSYETRRKISESLRGKKHPNWNKHLSEETRKKIGKANKGKCGLKGEKNHHWDGGYNSNNIPKYDTYAHQLEWCEDVRRNSEDPNIMEVRCTHCGKWFIPEIKTVRNRIQLLKNCKGFRGEHRFYCSEKCKKVCPLYKKSPEQLMRDDAIRSGRLKWLELDREMQHELKQLVLERDNHTCRKCGATDKPLHCHHIDPVAVNPIESADVDNCITLCIDCHKQAHQKDGCRYGQIKTCH